MTLDVTTKWIVEVFPFDSPIPSDGDFKGASNPVSFNLNSSFDVATAISNNMGVTSINLRRSKGSPDGQCQVSIAGPLPPNFYVGAWALVSSVAQDKAGTPVPLTRFIGQIENVDIAYNVSSDGNLYMQSSLKIREWSAMLRMLVRYDVMSIAAQATNVGAQARALTKFIGPLSQSDTNAAASYKKMETLMESSFNPYELSHLILSLIGAMNAEDSIETVRSLTKDEVLPNIATVAPFIPSALLQRLGVGSKVSLPSIGSSGSKNPFQAGFMRVLTGIQNEPFYNDGSWDGLFKGRTINDFVNSYKDGYKNSSIHPLTYGLQGIVSSGASAWDLLTTQCDNSLNEVYTDFLYESKADGSIVGKPMIVIRNKPLLIKKVRDSKIEGINIKEDLSSFALYDDLPRNAIPTESILSFRINSTFLNSPNYIRISYTPTFGLNKTGEPAALAGGLERLDAEMKRFGGNELEISTIYTNTEDIGIKNASNRKGGGLIEWFQQLKELTKAWYSYNYRMASGVLVLKENGLPLSVGNNIQFNFGQYKIVAHIESISCDYQIEADGLHTNTTTLMLSSIVQETEDGLDFIDMTHFGNLLHATPTVSKFGIGNGSIKLAKNFISKVTGFNV